MQIKQQPTIGIQKFGVVYKPRNSAGFGQSSVDSEAVRLTFFQRLRFKFRKLIKLVNVYLTKYEKIIRGQKDG